MGNFYGLAKSPRDGKVLFFYNDGNIVDSKTFATEAAAEEYLAKWQAKVKALKM